MSSFFPKAPPGSPVRAAVISAAMAGFIAAGILERQGYDLFDVVSLILLPAVVAFGVAFRVQTGRRDAYLAELERHVFGEEDQRRWKAYAWRAAARRRAEESP